MNTMPKLSSEERRAAIVHAVRRVFAPCAVPERFKRDYSIPHALRPSQIRATSIDAVLMIQGALALRGGYRDLNLPVVIMAGDGDKVVFKRMSERLHTHIPHSMLHIIEELLPDGVEAPFPFWFYMAPAHR